MTLEILELACLVNLGIKASLEEKETQEKMEKKEIKDQLEIRDLQGRLGHQETQVCCFNVTT